MNGRRHCDIQHHHGGGARDAMFVGKAPGTTRPRSYAGPKKAKSIIIGTDELFRISRRTYLSWCSHAAFATTRQ
jgi:hypothetical protein